MSKTFHAIYEQGILKLDTALGLPEHTRVTGLVTSVDTQQIDSFQSDIPDDEFDRMLDEFCMTGSNPLPSNFSRADIYSDHD
jgi:predicted DNA-binding antitoxin AbrB/MazE fold protein